MIKPTEFHIQICTSTLYQRVPLIQVNYPLAFFGELYTHRSTPINILTSVERCTVNDGLLRASFVFLSFIGVMFSVV